MKTNCSKSWMALALLLGCGSRTPLDDWQGVEPAGPGAGGVAAQGGFANGTSAIVGGSLATGGSGDGAVRGGQVATGGQGVSTSAGGNAVIGGTGGTGGTIQSSSTVTGGRGASTSGGGSTVVGGRGASTSGGGSTVVGGRGASTSGGGSTVGGRGGSTSAGGSTVVGGRGGTTSGGGTSAVGGSGGTTSCPALAANEEMIDDMNDGDRFIPQVHGRAGAWDDADDGTPGSTMFPDPNKPFTMTDTGDVCRKYAAYVYGGPFVDGPPSFWFGIGGPYDASAFDGISFWAKIDSGTSTGLRVDFPDKDTMPDGALCSETDSSNLCWNHYGKRLNLTTTWTKYSVDFSSLTQDGWGRKGTSFDRSTIYRVEFQLPENAKFGVWIDDVSLHTYF